MNDLAPFEFRTHERGLAAARERLAASQRAVYRPRPRISVPDWADRYRVLSSSAAAVAGPWETHRFEVARGPMMAVSEPGVRTITIACSTQTMKTSVLENIIGRHMHLDPCPILLLEPKDEMAEAFSKERLAPMMRASPVLRDLGDRRTRTSADTMSWKQFPGGFLAMAGAGSPTNLAMRSIRIVLEDEIDKYETTKEGDPIALAEERMATFTSNSLAVRACSPTIEETSRIWRSYLDGDQRLPFMRCPHCDHLQHPTFFKHVIWNRDAIGGHEPESAKLHCEMCGAEWSEAQRMRIITEKFGVPYYQTKPFECCGERQNPLEERLWDWSDELQVGYARCKHCGDHPISNAHASYNASKIFSPVITIAEIARRWFASKDDAETKQTFFNTVLGLPFRAEVQKAASTHALMKRLEVFPEKPLVPEEVLAISCGVDVQAGGESSRPRLEAEIVGWGLGEESWSLDVPVFYGDPSQPKVWEELDEYLLKAWRHPLGFDIKIEGTCIDSGGANTNDVYAFCRARIQRNVWAIKGSPDRSKQWSPLWPPLQQDRRKRRRTGYRPVMLGVNSGKESVRQRLLIEQPGPGFAHFPLGREEAYFEQLTSEQLMLRKESGVSFREWVLPKGRANEAIDMRVYAYAALLGLRAVRLVSLEERAIMHDRIRQRGSTPPPPAQGRRVTPSRFMQGK